MELFVGVANMLGEGLPLAYLFITTEANAVLHTKQKALVAWVQALSSLGIDPRFTLSDKDQTEINALRQVWPEAKHQLCLWHILRAIKHRLSLNEPPSSYNILEADDAFLDIDVSFIPLGQMNANERVCTLVFYWFGLIPAVQSTIAPPAMPLARVHLCINGKAAVFTPNIMLTLRIPKVNNGAVPVAVDSTWMSETMTNDLDKNLEIDVLVEGDNDHASDGEDGLARCAHKQAAGTLNVYKEDGQWLPGDGVYGTEKDEEDKLTNVETDIIHAAEQLALQQDEAASDPEDESANESAGEWEVDDKGMESSDGDHNSDGDFIPTLKLKEWGMPKEFKARVLDFLFIMTIPFPLLCIFP